MGASHQVDRWECETKPERAISAQAMVDDKPPPRWRVVIKDGGKIRRVRVAAMTELNAIELVNRELPGTVILLIESVSQMR